MTDARATQISAEQWAQATPQARTTQVAIEQWSSAIVAPVIAAVSQVALEEWAIVVAVAPPSTPTAAILLVGM